MVKKALISPIADPGKCPRINLGSHHAHNIVNLKIIDFVDQGKIRSLESDREWKTFLGRRWQKKGNLPKKPSYFMLKNLKIDQADLGRRKKSGPRLL